MILEYFWKQFFRQRGGLWPPLRERVVLAWRMHQCAKLIQKGPPYRRMRWVKFVVVLLAGCAQAPGTITVNCAAQDLSGVSGGAAASCATISITGNTPTATATTTATVPVSAAGGLSVPGLSGAAVMPQVAPASGGQPPAAAASQRAGRASTPRRAARSTLREMLPPRVLFPSTSPTFSFRFPGPMFVRDAEGYLHTVDYEQKRRKIS